jgi:hypothetical protein
LKTVFLVAVASLPIAFLVPASLLLDAMFPIKRGVGGHYQEGDRLFPAIIALGVCLYSANWIVSLLFRFSRLSDKRLSIFSKRRSG